MAEPAVFKPILRVSMRDQVRDWLLESILDGQFQPGERLVETDVARRLGTSPSPVREALRELEALGVITSKPFSGTRVRRITPAEVLDTYPVRIALESLAIRSGINRLTDEDVAALDALTDRMLRAARRGNSREQSRLNAEFHRRLAGISGNPALLRSWSVLEPLTRTYLPADFAGFDLVEDCEEHRPIVAALRARHADAAVAALVRHLEHVTQEVELAVKAEAELGTDA